jgi:hypothetical protein
MELYLHFPIRLLGIVLNYEYLSTGTTSHVFLTVTSTWRIKGMLGNRKKLLLKCYETMALTNLLYI